MGGASPVESPRTRVTSKRRRDVNPEKVWISVKSVDVSKCLLHVFVCLLHRPRPRPHIFSLLVRVSHAPFKSRGCLLLVMMAQNDRTLHRFCCLWFCPVLFGFCPGRTSENMTEPGGTSSNLPPKRLCSPDQPIRPLTGVLTSEVGVSTCELPSCGREV